MSGEVEKYQARIAELEGIVSRAQSSGEDADEKLEKMVEVHKNLMNKLCNEQATSVNLKLRIHFKKQLHERNEKVTISKCDVEKSTMKTAKAVESLEKKLERKEARKRDLIEEVKRNREAVDLHIAHNPSSVRSKNALLEIQLMESQAESKHLFAMISTMGSKIESQDLDLNTTLKVLRQKHLCLMGHDWASQSDRKEYEDLRDQLLERQLKWSENLNEYSDKDAEIQAIHIYNEAAKLDLPTLEPGERPKSVEQKVLFEDTIVTGENNGSIFNNDTIILETTVEKHESKPAITKPIFTKTEIVDPVLSILPPTPNLRTMHDDEMLPETPRIFANLNSSIDLLPPTPQLNLDRPPAPLLRKESDKSFLNTTPTPPILQGLKKSAYDPEPSTPKRAAEEIPDMESASKKTRLDVPVDGNTWAVHREPVTIPATPKAESIRGPSLNETFDATQSPPSTVQDAASNLNETVTLVNKLDTQCELNSPAMKPAGPRNLNSTFAVDDEPMDVDSTNNAKLVSARSFLSASDMSVIHPPHSSKVSIPNSPNSPVKAGMGIKSPTYAGIRSPSPLPIRESTVLDMKAAKGSSITASPSLAPRRSPRNESGASSQMAPPRTVTVPSAKKPRQTPGKSSTTPQPVRKSTTKRSLTHSVSTSVLPRPGQPVSFR